MENVAAILEADHAELHELLGNVLASVSDEDLPRCFKAMDLFWARLAMHIRAEHLHLFPFVRGISDEQTGQLLDELRLDHDMFMTELARAIKALRLAFDFGNEAETFANVRDLIDRVAARLAVHDGIEEQRIYPQVLAHALSRGKMLSLHEAVRSELQNYPQRFAAEKP